MNDIDDDTQTQRKPGDSSFDGKLPFSRWLPLLLGVAVGLAIRAVFSGHAGNRYTAKAASFIYLAPILVGFVTVYAAERQQRRSFGYYFHAPMFANVLFIVGTLLIMIEGLICAILIVPLFGMLGGLAGLVMGLICRLTNWPKPRNIWIAWSSLGVTLRRSQTRMTSMSCWLPRTATVSS